MHNNHHRCFIDFALKSESIYFIQINKQLFMMNTKNGNKIILLKSTKKLTV